MWDSGRVGHLSRESDLRLSDWLLDVLPYSNSGHADAGCKSLRSLHRSAPSRAWQKREGVADRGAVPCFDPLRRRLELMVARLQPSQAPPVVSRVGLGRRMWKSKSLQGSEVDLVCISSVPFFQAVRIARSARYNGLLLHIANTAPRLICISVTLPFHP